MLYQDYLMLIERAEMIEEKTKQLEIFISEYNEKIKRDPNYKMIYYPQHEHCY